MKDQQEAEGKKVTSQDIQAALAKQTKVISEKRSSVMEDLAKVEPAVIDAQNGINVYTFTCIATYFLKVFSIIYITSFIEFVFISNQKYFACMG